MTPGARIAAAIEVLDAVNSGLATEQALTRWARAHRFAGSKDRAAIRDHVYDVQRCRRMAAHLGGSEDGRSLMLGLLRLQEVDPEPLFSGQGHAPGPLSDVEWLLPQEPPSRGQQWNLPDWLLAPFEAALGDAAEPAAMMLQSRAPVALRVNAARIDRGRMAAQLAEEGIITTPSPLADTALIVTDGARRIRNSTAYQTGLVELQDAASQALVAGLPHAHRVLDYCAGGGGKALALAARQECQVTAHDADRGRMRDLPARAARAGARIALATTPELAAAAPFDLVLCDAPCSGSGAWRRAPDGKWALTPQRLAELNRLQSDILDAAALLVGTGGTLAYATCSVLTEENDEIITSFLARNPGWLCNLQHSFPIETENDGFFIAHLTRD